MDLSTEELRKNAIHDLHDKYLSKLKKLGYPDDTSLIIHRYSIEVGQCKKKPKHRFDSNFGTTISIYGNVKDMMGMQEPYFSVSSMSSITPENTEMVFKLKSSALTLQKYDEVIQIATDASNDINNLWNEIDKVEANGKA